MNRKLIGIALLLLFTNFVYAEEQQANFLVIEGNSRFQMRKSLSILDFKLEKYITTKISQI